MFKTKSLANNSLNCDFRSIRMPLRFYSHLPSIAGPLLTFFLAVAIELVKQSNINLYGLTTFFCVTILLSIYLGGYKPGKISVLIALLYTLYFSVVHNLLVYHSLYYFVLNITQVLVYAGIFYFGGKIQKALRQKISELQDVNDTFLELFDNTSDAIFIHKLESDKEDVFSKKFYKVNKRACKMLGYSREDLLELSPRDVVEDTHLACKRIKNLSQNTHSITEMNVISKDGAVIPVEINSHIFYLKNEKVMMAMVRDITIRKQAEEKLRKSEELYRELVEFCPFGIFMQVGKRLTFANKACLNLLGISKIEDILGKSVLSFVHPHYIETAKERIQHMVEYGEPLPLNEYKLVRQNKQVVDVEITSLPIPRGRPTFVGIVIDITERKKAEQLQREVTEKEMMLKETLELDRIRTEFFANISHEFRTPLNVILSALKLLKRDVKTLENKKLSKNFNIIYQNCFRLLRLINNLIDITKIDSGYFELKLQKGNIVNVVEEITLSVAQYIESKDISLTFDTDIEEKTMVFDPDAIERVMLNLLSNAIKFTGPGGAIDVNIYDKGEGVLISVRDNGIGIPKDKQSVIFERFRQADQSLTRKREGSGIGLSLVKSLVEFHQGTISVESRYGRGSNFLIKIPNILAEGSNIKRVDKSHSIRQKQVERVKIEFSDIYQF